MWLRLLLGLPSKSSLSVSAEYPSLPTADCSSHKEMIWLCPKNSCYSPLPQSPKWTALRIRLWSHPLFCWGKTPCQSIEISGSQTWFLPQLESHLLVLFSLYPLACRPCLAQEPGANQTWHEKDYKFWNHSPLCPWALIFHLSAAVPVHLQPQLQVRELVHAQRVNNFHRELPAGGKKSRGGLWGLIYIRLIL